MGYLSGSSVYLVGPVDHSEDPYKWRRNLRSELTPLNIKIYDPLVKPSWFKDTCIDNIFLYKDHLKSTQENKVIWNSMTTVHEMCMRMANDCNFMIVNLPQKFTVGTFQEITCAANAKKPIFFHIPDGYDTSTWLPVQVFNSLDDYRSYCFNNWGDLIEKVKSIDNGEFDSMVDRLRWIFISYFNDKDIMNEFTINE